MEVPYSFRRGDTGIYVYRRRVPSDLQHVVGKEWWKVSLRTPLLTEARAKAMALAAEQDRVIKAHRGKAGPEQRLAELEALQGQQADARTLFQTQFVEKPWTEELGKRAKTEGSLWTERQSAIQRIAMQMLAEAEKHLTTLSENDRAMVEAGGGLASFVQQTQLMAGVNAHLQETFKNPTVADSEEQISAAEQFRRREELERMQAELGSNARQVRNRQVVLEKLNLQSRDGVGTEDPNNPRITTVLEQWLKHQKQGSSAARRHRVSWRRFIEVFGNIPVREIGRTQVLQFRTVCESIPDTRKVSAKDRGLALSALNGTDLPTISPGTVERHLGSLKAMLKWCISNVAEFGNTNVAAGVVAAKDRRKQSEKVRSFRPDELRTILAEASKHYDASRGRRHRNRDMLWLIYTACYSGCRLEELCQLARENVREVRGIWVLDINSNEKRKLKNHFSERLVPIHPVLIERGFLDFAKDGDGGRVFSSLKLIGSVGGASYGNAASSSFARFLDKIGMADPTLKFHSFRHTFIEASRNAEVPYNIELALAGHQDKQNPVHGGYGSPARIELLAKWIAKIDPLA